MKAAINFETLVSSIAVENDYDIRIYAKEEISNQLGIEISDLIEKSVRGHDDKKYKEFCEKVSCVESLTLENITNMILTVDKIRRKKKVRLPISGIMAMYHSDDKFLVARAKDHIIRNYGRYIHDIIHKHYPTYADKYEEELYNSGVEGMMIAMKNYDLERGAFTTYSKLFVMHEISKQINFYHNDTTVYYNTVQKKINEAIKYLRSMDEEPTIARIAIQAELKSDIVQRELEYMEATKFRYLDADDEQEQASEYEQSPEYLTSKKEGMEKLFESIDRLGKKDPRIRDVVLLKYDGSRTNEDVANQLGITIGQVKTFYTRGINMLKKDEPLRHTYSEYLSDADRAMQKYSVQRVEPRKVTEEHMDELESFMGLSNDLIQQTLPVDGLSQAMMSINACSV